ncbi:MAG TPA: biotin transporter BioY [Sutterella sp.]|nr:biotin transporter BioY [Sutterella sp.]
MNDARTLARNFVLHHRFVSFLFAVTVLTLSSKVAVSIGPVPLTMQTLAVTLTGVLLGAKFGAMTVLFWVMLGFSGIPVFAFGNAGLAALLGPTAGFLYSFPLIAYVAGHLGATGGVIRIFFAMLIANFLCLIVGTAWLSMSMAVPSAIAAGFVPFIVGALLKSVLGAAFMSAIGFVTPWK